MSIDFAKELRASGVPEQIRQMLISQINQGDIEFTAMLASYISFTIFKPDATDAEKALYDEFLTKKMKDKADEIADLLEINYFKSK